MILLGNKELSLILLGKNAVAQVYRGVTLVWEAVRSCFGAGFWKNDAPWSNTEGWKN